MQHELISQKIYTHEISYIAKDEFQINDKIDQTKINTIQNFMKTQKTVISVTKTEEIFNEKKIKRLNSQRQLFNSIPYPVVFWLNESFMTSFSEFATDFMSDNTAFFEFTEKDLWVQSKIPLGSPYGFNNSDWNYVSKRSSLNHTLVVTIGYQFKSSFYDSKNLIKNIKSMFRKSIKKYNQETGSVIKLKFITLGAGYGEHLFNAIARDIISADIAVFDTSDQNPNVMLEMGVALTWAFLFCLYEKRLVLHRHPIFLVKHGITYNNSGSDFEIDDHYNKLTELIENAMMKKIKINFLIVLHK